MSYPVYPTKSTIDAKEADAPGAIKRAVSRASNEARKLLR